MHSSKNGGESPSERFTTTYEWDYNARGGGCPQMNNTTQALSALTLDSQSQAKREGWPVFYKHCYKTTNNPSCSGGGFQFPTFPSNFDFHTPGACEVYPDVNGHQQHCICANFMKQPEVREEPPPKTDVHCQEGVIMFSSPVDSTCWKDSLRDVGLQHLLNSSLPPVVGSMIINRDGQNTSCLWRSRPASEAQAQPVTLPPCRQCRCISWKAEEPASCSSQMQPVPTYSSVPPSPVGQSTLNKTPHRRYPQLTEYQSNYTDKSPQALSQLNGSLSFRAAHSG